MNKKVKSYKDIIEIPKKLKQKLPTSYDVIGNISILKLDDDLYEYRKLIGDALLECNKNLKTVCLTHAVKGELRTRDIEIIAGENTTETVHKEFGLRFSIDIRKAYFSPRLATERKYIADLVQPNETILDMFTGVAPFPIMISKFSKPKIVYAIDKNPDAIFYAKKNLILNNVLDKIELINGDSKLNCKELEKKGFKADRIIMNLPFSSIDFFDSALLLIKKECIIHMYNIIKVDDLQEKIKSLNQKANEKNLKIKIKNIRRIKSYAPREFYMGIDITAKKLPM
jgi:tRNA (guanine37-N1)-methyltransferase